MVVWITGTGRIKKTDRTFHHKCSALADRFLYSPTMPPFYFKRRERQDANRENRPRFGDNRIGIQTGRSRQTLGSGSWPSLIGRARSATLLLFDSFLHIDFENAKRLFVALNRRLKSEQHPLGGIEIHDNPLGHANGSHRHSDRLGLRPKSTVHFFQSKRSKTVHLRCRSVRTRSRRRQGNSRRTQTSDQTS